MASTCKTGARRGFACPLLPLSNKFDSRNCSINPGLGRLPRRASYILSNVSDVVTQFACAYPGSDGGSHRCPMCASKARLAAFQLCRFRVSALPRQFRRNMLFLSPRSRIAIESENADRPSRSGAGLLVADAGRMAAAAVFAHQLGAMAIDINFGCPARTVNRDHGGVMLLQHPKRIREIVAAMRSALPAEIPVSAKLRLGWDSIESIDANAEMAAEGGAAWLTIHARTRTQGYAPPVYWSPIGRVREWSSFPGRRQWRHLDDRGISPLPRGNRLPPFHARPRGVGQSTGWPVRSLRIWG